MKARRRPKVRNNKAFTLRWSENSVPTVKNWEKKFIQNIGWCYVHKITGKILRIINRSTE